MVACQLSNDVMQSHVMFHLPSCLCHTIVSQKYKQGWGSIKKELELTNSIPKLERELKLKDFEQNESNWNWKILNWTGIEWKGIEHMIFCMLCRQWCLMTKTSWTMKLLVKHYPATNQWIKLMNGKSIRLVLLACVNECWLGTVSKNHWNCPDNNHTFPVSHAKQILGLPRWGQ